MKIETLKDRIEKAEIKVIKKQNTIEKKQKSIEKKTAMLMKKYNVDAENFDKYDKEARTLYGKTPEGESEIFWSLCDIQHYKEDIERITKEIPEIKNTIEKYKKQLSGEIEKESILNNEIPESLKTMQTELVNRWNVWDLERKERILEDRRNMTYKDFHQKYRGQDTNIADMTAEQINESNIQDAKSLVIDLYRRIKHITGEITNWDSVRAEQGSQGFTVLNGIVQGKEGKAIVESILAGGYNIQRLHVRVLVHSV